MTTADSARENMIKKIQGLMALADPNSNTFQGEIESASRMIQTLMDKYQIEWAEVMFTKEEQKQEAFDKVFTVAFIGSLKAWHWRLAQIVARITGTRHYASGGRNTTLRDPKKVTAGHYMAFFGMKGSIQIAADLFDKWVVIIDDMAKIATAEYVQKMTDLYSEEMEYQGVKQFRHLRNLGSAHPNVMRDSWLSGVVAGISEALDQNEKQRTVEVGSSLMVINKKVDLAYHEFSTGFKRSTNRGHSNFNPSAYTAGREVGRSLNLNQQGLGTGRKRIGG